MVSPSNVAAMKCPLLVALLTALSLSVGLAASGSPVSRVAELLQNLASKIDGELDAETKLYEEYVCWAKTVIASKTASNDKAESRVDSLKTYLADVEAGRIELTSERSDLEKEVNGLQRDIETSTALRKQEEVDYKAATSEMEKAIKALETAVKVLGEATKDSKAAGLVSLRSHISHVALEHESQGFASRVEEANELERAVTVGSKWLKKGDALFLQRLLSGEVPKADWKKLNRKADFKMKYKERSGKIQETLTKLLQSFKDNKADADKKEKEATDVYNTLKKAKDSQLNAAQESLTKQDVEGGAAAVSKSDAKAEIKSLETQLADDKKYISETNTALEAKKKEFSARKSLRVGEIAAINEALAVIHSDDARDLFKKSISLVQVDNVLATASAAATAVLLDTARSTGDSRLSALVALLSLKSGAKFDKVISSVDKMLIVLKKEEDDDLSNKEDCEKTRAADTKEAADLSRTIDELSDSVTKLASEIKEIETEVEEKLGSVATIKNEVKDANRMRADENAEWKQNDADDTSAIALLEKSSGILKTFYKTNFALMQKANSRDTSVVTGGAAPPPPPQTWGGDYGGAKKESSGIVGILELIKADVEKDQTSAKTAEDTAQKNHDKFVKESEDSIKKLDAAINTLNESKGKKEEEQDTKKATSGNKKGSLNTVIKKMKDAAPACDFLLTNFKVRTENRQLEMDGLNKAKTILKAQNK